MNNDYLIQSIMEQSRHNFIYGYKIIDRDLFVEKLQGNYPVVINTKKPMAIKLNDLGLPNLKQVNENINQSPIKVISNEYLSFSIASSILNKIMNDLDCDILNKITPRFLRNLETTHLNGGKLSSLSELKEILIEGKKTYLTAFKNYLETGNFDIDIDNLKISFIYLETLLSEYKKMLNNDSHFNLIIDNNERVSIYSYLAINSLVGSRINRDLSLKVITDLASWPTYETYNNQLVEAIHDYGVVELDNNLKEQILKLKKN